MPELISSPPFLIIVAIFAIFLVIGIVKRGVRLLIWIVVIFVILVCLGIAKQSDLLNWFEDLIKTVKALRAGQDAPPTVFEASRFLLHDVFTCTTGKISLPTGALTRSG